MGVQDFECMLDESKTEPRNPELKVYTGDLIIGIGTMHKSNSVPVINSNVAKDLSTMRR